MLYFDYGSNMLTSRLRNRVPSASKINNAILPDYSLFYHKRSIDGSGKCNIKQTNGSLVHGIIFKIDENEKPDLDRAEGLGSGYEETQIEVYVEDDPVKVFTYVASESHMDSSLHPYDWYKILVLEGAREHGLPEKYINAIEEVNTVRDPNQERRDRGLKNLH